MESAVNAGLVVPLSIGSMLIVGVSDFATGVETTFTLLYLFPLAFGTWFRGSKFGVFLAILATLCAALTAAFTSHPAPRLGPFVWNQSATFATMLIKVWLLTALRSYVERERSSRALAVEQLRHAERLNIIGKLAAGVAHELGTPLNVISGSAEMLEGTEPTHSNVTRYTTIILEQTKKMTLIIRHLLDFGRRGGASRMTLDLNELGSHAVELLLPMANKRDCQLLFEAGPLSVPVVVNAMEIEQVFSNLIVNALQAMSKGGTARVRVAVEARETRGAAFRPFAYVTVRDDGPGISEQDIPRVFYPFFTTNEVGEGTGLGLSVSYGIVEDHGGTIEVSSEQGSGACFGVLLPLATSRDRAAPPPAAVGEDAGAG